MKVATHRETSKRNRLYATLGVRVLQFAGKSNPKPGAIRFRVVSLAAHRLHNADPLRWRKLARKRGNHPHGWANNKETFR
jgi:hypothetical protein